MSASWHLAGVLRVPAPNARTNVTATSLWIADDTYKESHGGMFDSHTIFQLFYGKYTEISDTSLDDYNSMSFILMFIK